MAKKKIKSKLWVEEQLSGRTSYWDELLRSGRVDMDNLEDGELKNALQAYLDAESAVTQLLEELEYEAG